MWKKVALFAAGSFSKISPLKIRGARGVMKQATT